MLVSAKLAFPGAGGHSRYAEAYAASIAAKGRISLSAAVNRI